MFTVMDYLPNKFLQVDFFTTTKVMKMDGWLALRNLIKYDTLQKIVDSDVKQHAEYFISLEDKN